MIDREKVIDELKEMVMVCAIYGDDEAIETLNSAISMLKEQEPRVMKFEELNIDADESVVCWVEFASKSAVNVTAPYKGMSHICLPFLGTETITFVVERNYGKKWRCWTSRPTEEQRKAVAWEGENNE